MDPNDQPTRQEPAESTTGQPTVNDPQTGQATAPDEVETVEVNGEKVTLDELKAGYMRQSDYTKKTQELSQERKQIEGDKRAFSRTSTAKEEEREVDPDVQKAIELLKDHGVVTKEDLKQLQAQQEDERKLQRLLEANPDLKGKEDAIKAIGKTDNRAWEDIIHNYGFKESNKIVKAKMRGIKGEPASKEPPKQKSVGEMSSAEYAEWKKSNLKNSIF